SEAAALPLWRYVGGSSAHVLPVPMMNVINGGAHADNPIDIQEFMILPVSAPTMADAVRMGSETFHVLKSTLKANPPNTNVGDEGGFAPNLRTTEEALDFLLVAIEKAGYNAGKDIALALDCAASEYYKGGKYEMEGAGKSFTSDQMVDYLAKLAQTYSIVS